MIIISNQRAAQPGELDVGFALHKEALHRLPARNGLPECVEGRQFWPLALAHVVELLHGVPRHAPDRLVVSHGLRERVQPLDEPHVVGTLPTVFRNMVVTARCVDGADPVRRLRSSGDVCSKGRCAGPRDRVSETALVHDIVRIHGKHGGAQKQQEHSPTPSRLASD